MAEVFRDEWGIPHLRAGSVDELAYLQGRITVRDRGRQLDVGRRRAEGLLAELIGPAELGWDRFARRVRLDDTAQRCFAALDPETRRWVTAYAEGVSTELPGWKPWSSLGVFLAQHILFGTFPMKMWRAHVTRTLGPSFVDLFATEERGSGSNAWTTPGLIAGDPHRVIELPGVYQQIRLACPEFDVAGLTFPGVPGVQHFGHAGEVAWAVTNASADYQDLYREELRRTADGGVEVRSPAGWERASAHTETIPVRGQPPVTVEVIETPRGPIVDADLSLRTPTRVESDLGFSALLPLLRAKSADDVAAALRHWVEPVNSVLVGDRTGRRLQLCVGRVPLRDPENRRVPVPAADPRFAWRGYAAMHVSTITGTAVNANERRPDTEPYGDDFPPPNRANRIATLLAAGAAPEAVHMDTEIAGVRMDADSAAAGARAARRAALARVLCEHPALRPLHGPTGHDPLFLPWLDVATRIGMAVEPLAARFGVSVPAPASGPWGDRHVLIPVRSPGFDFDLPRVAVSGDADCVLATYAIPGVTDVCSRGPVARYVWDLADRSGSRWIVPFGASGRPDSPHVADQLACWASGELIPLVTDWSELEHEPI